METNLTKKITKQLTRILLVCSMLAFSLATPSALAQRASDTTKISGPRKQIATIVFAGLAGAILGLSTLSFYGRPQDKLNNIGIGAAVGVFVGAGYTAYQATTQPREFYGLESELKSQMLSYRTMDPPTITPKLGYSWSF